MSECTHDCSTCKSDCGSRDMREKTNEHNHIKRVIGVNLRDLYLTAFLPPQKLRAIPSPCILA